GEENGGYDSISEAAKQMVPSGETKYYPNEENVKKYQVLYKEYKKLVEYFGKGKNDVMKLLKNF
ncbi:MAG TPA: ribulokinase, partial [Pseudogracilibacillus sp.]|nr:ribulokinase [Pseudogracilibacillus sp.]